MLLVRWHSCCIQPQAMTILLVLEFLARLSRHIFCYPGGPSTQYLRSLVKASGLGTAQCMLNRARNGMGVHLRQQFKYDLLEEDRCSGCSSLVWWHCVAAFCIGNSQTVPCRKSNLAVCLNNQAESLIVLQRAYLA